MNRFRHTSRQSYMSRVGGAIAGVVVGLLMVPASMGLIFWNEGRAVKTRKTLEEGAGRVVILPSATVDASHEGALVHLTGVATTDETVADDTFGVSVPAIRLERNAEMYQWRELKRSETRKRTGGSSETTTTYEYEQAWESNLVSSEGFKHPEGHQNPGTMPFPDATFTASRVTLGGFQLSDTLVAKIGGARPLPIDDVAAIDAAVRDRVAVRDGGLYVGTDPAAPKVGDERIEFEVVEPREVSVVARQQGGDLVPYVALAGGTIAMLVDGAQPAASMFQAAQQANTALTWGLRFVGTLVMFIGFVLMLKPLSVMADLLPILGSLVGFGAALVALLVSGVVSMVTMAVAWLVFRPLFGIALLFVAFLFFAGLVVVLLKARQATKAKSQGLAGA